MVRMWHMVRCCLVVMGFTSTLTYLGPFIYIPMTIPVRLYVQVKVDIITMYVSIIIILPIYLSSSLHCQSVVQVLMCLLETAETILRQVTIRVYLSQLFYPWALCHSPGSRQAKNLGAGGGLTESRVRRVGRVVSDIVIIPIYIHVIFVSCII